MDGEEGESMNGEERFGKKAKRNAIIVSLLIVIFLLCNIIFFDFLWTCTGSLVNGIFLGILILILYFSYREAKEKMVVYCFYVWAVFMVLIFILTIRLECTTP